MPLSNSLLSGLFHVSTVEGIHRRRLLEKSVPGADGRGVLTKKEKAVPVLKAPKSRRKEDSTSPTPELEYYFLLLFL